MTAAIVITTSIIPGITVTMAIMTTYKPFERLALFVGSSSALILNPAIHSLKHEGKATLICLTDWL